MEGGSSGERRARERQVMKVGDKEKREIVALDR
jgi:hypothetical protein